jgi:hypothetical protein
MKKIFFILFTLVAFISYGQSVLTDVNGKVITSATGDILVQETDPNNFEYTPNAEWIPVNGVADNEIWILAFDGSGDGYSSFTCTTESSVDYAMDIYGGADGKTLLQTIDTASGKPINFRIPTGIGKYCYSEGYYTYKLVVRSTNPAKSILTFEVQKHPSTTITYNRWKIINCGTKNLTSISCYNGHTYGYEQTLQSYCPNLLYGNIWQCTNISGFIGFAYSGLVEFTMPKYANNIIVLKSSNYAGIGSGSFADCFYLEKITMPITMNELQYLGGTADGYIGSNQGAFVNCTLLKTITLPDNMPKLIKLGGRSSGNIFNGAFAGCSSLTSINGLNNAPLITSFVHCYTDNYLLTTIPTFTNLPTSSIPFTSTGLRALTTFNQPILRCSSFTLTGVSNADRSNINYIQIDWANSQFTGNIDIYYNNLSATELNRIFTELPTVVVSRTINVAGNVGSATCDPTIATAKNWIVITS